MDQVAVPLHLLNAGGARRPDDAVLYQKPAAERSVLLGTGPLIPPRRRPSGRDVQRGQARDVAAKLTHQPVVCDSEQVGYLHRGTLPEDRAGAALEAEDAVVIGGGD